MRQDPKSPSADDGVSSDPEASSQTALVSWRALSHPVNILALGWVIFQLALLIWPEIDLLVRRSGHLGFACALGIALALRQRAPSWLVLVLASIALLPVAYIALDLQRLYDRIPELDPVLWSDYLLGGLLLVLVLEISRRRLGAGLSVLAAVFILYQLLGSWIPGILGHRIEGLDIFFDTLFLGQSGLFGVPTGVSAEVIFYFILFAALYDAFGGGRLIMDLSLWLTGRRVGGPAKASVVSSALTGSISGSAVANVMSTGIFTIPLMKKAGYTPTFAAGTEAAASTAGQIMPPVMGAAAFIMADFLQIPYSTVALGALIPALAYLVGIMVAVHLQARLQGIQPIALAAAGSLKASLITRWHMLLPLVWLVTQIARGYDVVSAVIQASILTVVVGSLRKGTRQSLRTVIEALIRTSERAVVVALPCALASIVVMVISMTGLGTKFTAVILDMASGNIWLAALFGGLACLILGCGMPTTSAYIMAAILVAPALAELGFDPLVAHMFIFYIAVMANVTPPVALAAYAGASVAGCNANKAGWQAFRLALPGMAIAWTMLLQPTLVLWGEWWEVGIAIAQALSATALIAVVIVGWLGRPLNKPARALALVSVALIVLPSAQLSAVGYGLAVVLLIYGYAFRSADAASSGINQAGSAKEKSVCRQ
ncbi:TRAP transporter permease [Marinobacterium lutimaris]|uniref:TRAP transporter, 4TM/12TM fusion protein n=1 Tax=Marinobacterium lutimaris TaxID=568106 RepID=A0A1H6ALN3_9GAMM|nr:TRAP transporter fused permease subunit [Marinobacterium lutimaris]SEG48666.1 TRAP transporter, 4TM/12TM fusion protein [Marinobacterium lutimaris]